MTVLFDIILTGVAGQGVLMGLFLLFRNKKGDLQSNRLLGTYLICLAIFIYLPLIMRDNIVNYPHLIGIAFPLIFLFGPLSYLHIISMTGQSLSRTKAFPHFIPAILFAITRIPFYFSSATDKVEYLNVVIQQGLPIHLLILWTLACFQILLYNYISYRHLRAFDDHLLQLYSDISTSRLRWLAYFVVQNAIIWFIYTIIFVLFNLGFNIDPLGISDVIFSFGLGFLIVGFSYKLLLNPGISSGNTKREFDKYLKSGLDGTKADEIKMELCNAMDIDKLYLNPELTLVDLASRLDISTKHLSQVINQSFNRNFYDFVNSYRVEEAKKLMESKQNFKHLAIAFESGFRSKSTFNNAFKRMTQQTPSEYSKSLIT